MLVRLGLSGIRGIALHPKLFSRQGCSELRAIHPKHKFRKLFGYFRQEGLDWLANIFPQELAEWPAGLAIEIGPGIVTHVDCAIPIKERALKLRKLGIWRRVQDE